MKVRIFTDGACSGNPGSGGWAIVINTEYRCTTFSGSEELTTNNRMELKAVIAALTAIVNREKKFETKNEYEIYSDSAYVVNAVNQHWIEAWKLKDWKTSKGNDVKNKDLWEKLVELRSEIERLEVDLTFIKVKGHAGNTFNELVDKLAREESMKARANSK